MGGPPCGRLPPRAHRWRTGSTCFRAASARCRRFEPRFPLVTPHVLRHSFAVHTLRWLTRTQLATVAQLTGIAGADPAWALALRSQDPLLTLNVTLAQVPKVVIDAVVSTEDRHYFTEGAINPLSMMRAFAADVTGSRLQGGSTITQQYVKQAYLGSKRTLIRKIKEAVPGHPAVA
jgi:membrane peptidoglycan carboxypeptidase